MVNEKLVEIIKRLEEKTAQGLIRWEKTYDDRVFRASFPESSIMLVQKQNPFHGRMDYVLEVHDAAGNIVDDATSDDLYDLSSESGSALERLYREARRVALNVDETLDKMLHYLEA